MRTDGYFSRFNICAKNSYSGGQGLLLHLFVLSGGLFLASQFVSATGDPSSARRHSDLLTSVPAN